MTETTQVDIWREHKPRRKHLADPAEVIRDVDMRHLTFEENEPKPPVTDVFHVS